MRIRWVALLVASSVCAGCGAMLPTPPPPTTSTVTSVVPADAPTPLATREWDQVVAEVQSGVVNIAATGCEGLGWGSGALIDDDLVLTAAHVVEDATSLSIVTDDGQTAASLVGLDRDLDLALLRLADPQGGHVFDLVDRDPALASEVLLVGFPLESGLAVSGGRVSSFDETVDYGDVVLSGVIQTDAAVNPGNSGGPAIDREGRIVGVVTGKRRWVDPNEDVLAPAEGIGYLVPATDASVAVQQWRSRARTVDLLDCSGDVIEFTGLPEYDDYSGHPDAEGIMSTLYLHGAAINSSEYEIAFDLLSDAKQADLVSSEEWSAGLLTTVWQQVEINSVADAAGGDLVAQVTLMTTQSADDGHRGQTCSIWEIDYTMQQPVVGVWLIDQAKLSGGLEPTAC